MKVFVFDSAAAVIYYDYSLCLGLLKQGYTVELIACPFPVDPQISFDKINYKPIFFQFTSHFKPKQNTARYYKTFQIVKGIEYLFDILKFLFLVWRQRPDIVHIQWLAVPLIDKFWMKLLKWRGVNLIYTAHNILPHEKKNNDYSLFKEIYQLADKIIVHSACDKRMLKDEFSINESKISVIPHGNFDIYIVDEHLKKPDARQQIGLADDLMIVLFFGLIRPYKGIDCLLDAWEQVASKNKNARLLIVGKELVEVKTVTDKIRQHEFRSSITFINKYIPFFDVQKYFVASDLVVLPYRKTYNSGVLQLAYSFGVPVVSSRTGGISEALEDKSGVLVEPSDIKGLADTVYNLLKDKEKLKLLGCNARTLANTKYSWDIVARETGKLYSSAANSAV
jgi:glycosyltransferase involved in cell wall biosynthesis